MHRFALRAPALVCTAASLLAFGACSEDAGPLATDASTAELAAAPSRVAALVDAVNARFEKSGSTVRLDEAWFFTVGPGTDSFRRLRTGSRWGDPQVSYIPDASDYTSDLPASVVDASLVSSYRRWDGAGGTSVLATRIGDHERNPDILDVIVRDRKTGECVDVFDDRFPTFDPATGSFEPFADIVVGGWLQPEYFADCLGSSSIIAVTWTFSDVDRDGDNFRDRLYVEQYYNTAFEWTTTDAVYLDFDAPMDLETIAVHENGHAHGLGHFGGPNENEPFKLQPNGTVFDPEAVMNPFYIGGEKRDLYSTDVAALQTLY